MQNVRRRLRALEKSLSLQQGPQVWVVQRNPVTGKWNNPTHNGADPSMCVVLMYSDSDPDPALVTDAAPRITDPAAQ